MLFHTKKGNVILKFDLASEYYHIRVSRDIFKYLGFSWIY